MPDITNHCELVMFADDSKCYKAIRKTSDSCVYSVGLQDDLNTLSRWSIINEIQFQPFKCHNLRVSRKRSKLNCSYNIDGVSIKSVHSESDLGVVVINDLTWN